MFIRDISIAVFDLATRAGFEANSAGMLCIALPFAC